MQLPSLTVVVSGLFMAYILHGLWNIAQLIIPPSCSAQKQCILPHLMKLPKLQMLFYLSTRLTPYKESDVELLDVWKNFDFKSEFDKEYNVTLAAKVSSKSPLYIHVVLVAGQTDDTRWSVARYSPYATYSYHQLTENQLPQSKSFNLLSSDKKEDPSSETKGGAPVKPVPHFRTRLPVHVVTDVISLPTKGFPPDLHMFIRLSPHNEYLPIIFINELNTRLTDMKEIGDRNRAMKFTLTYSPISFGRLRLWVQFTQAMKQMKNLGFSNKDLDEVKGIFTDTNMYLLIVTMFVASVHLLFDFLAFKNDIIFWRRKSSMTGLSSRTVLWRAFSQFVIFLYLLEEETSLLVVIPMGIGTLIEFWKVKKAFKVSLKADGLLPRIKLGRVLDEERQTEEFDSESMRYLSYVLYPICICGAIGSLIYLEHKSWYSWTIQCLANGVYAFGFLFMLPQLFVNYKLKSVAHLPWKALMYKAFNTFIDDLFAFIITMPTAHRVACFRDDVVFVVYIYQRWLYPVDKTRVEGYEDKVEKKKQ